MKKRAKFTRMDNILFQFVHVFGQRASSFRDWLAEISTLLLFLFFPSLNIVPLISFPLDLREQLRTHDRTCREPRQEIEHIINHKAFMRNFGEFYGPGILKCYFAYLSNMRQSLK